MLDLITFIVVGAGILQLPLIMDLIQYLFPGSPLGRAVTRFMRWLLLIALTFSVTAALYTNLSTLLRPHIAGWTPASLEGEHDWSGVLRPQFLLHMLLSVWLYAQLLNHFYDACTQHASRIRRPANPVVAPAAHHLSAAAQGSEPVCRHCGVQKRLRTHHCRICNVCVELMDHHCPFTGQCVGLSNFRAFYLFLCYGLLGISYACYMSYAPFKLCFLASFGVEAEEWQRTSGPLCEKVGRASLVFLPAFFGWLSTAFLFFFQTLLLHRDVTTIEYLTSLTQLRLRVEAPSEVQQEQQKRDGAAVKRKKVGEGASPFNGATLDTDDEGQTTAVASSAELMESGALRVDSACAPSSPPYNPHKSLRLLIIQHYPLWTLFVPPVLQRRSKRV